MSVRLGEAVELLRFLFPSPRLSAIQALDLQGKDALLGLLLEAVLDQGSIERPTSGPICESTCASGGPSVAVCPACERRREHAKAGMRRYREKKARGE